MKNKFLYHIITAVALLAATSVGAQKNYEGEIMLDGPVMQKHDNMLTVNMALDFSNMELNRRHMLTLTPILRSASGETSFPSVVVAGNRRYKVLKRSVALRNFKFEEEPYAVVRLNRRAPRYVDMSFELPFQEWMYGSDLVMGEALSGCAWRALSSDEYYARKNVFAKPAVSAYRLAYVVPDVELVKIRSSSYSAVLNFVVNESDILRGYMDNSVILDKVDGIIRDIKNDPDLTITELQVIGYASPEGNYNRNMILSRDRAFAFANYLHEQGLNNITTSWKGEDWNGLKAAIAASDLSFKNQVIGIIDDNANILQRKQRMLALGKEYRYLLTYYYPPLRRIDYTIAYIARPFNVEEAKGLIYTKPNYLSLNEMYLLAVSYPKDSPEFKKVFDVASRMYPQDPVAKLNNATLEIEKGALESGMATLVEVNMPEAWNNLGVASAAKEDYAQARQYFSKAAAAGLSVAASNLEMLDLYIQSR